MAVTVVIRTTATWVVFVLLTIFIALQVSGETEWHWLAVAVPLLIFDAACLLFLCLGLWTHLKRRRAYLPNNTWSAWRKLWFLLVLIVNVIAVFLVCLRLSGDLDTSYIAICIPLWIFLVAVTGDLSRVLIQDVIRPRQD